MQNKQIIRKQFGFTLKEFGIILLVYGVILVVPEWLARKELAQTCDPIQVGTRLEALKNSNPIFDKKINYFGCGFDEKTQTGSLVHLVRGWFPFGRDFCVVTFDEGVVSDKHIVYGNIDYDCDACKKDMRPIVEIEQKCDWSAR
jgi:hypothetical protein